MRRFTSFAAAFTAVTVSAPSRGDMAWQASSGTLAAEATFRAINTDLEITLTNTSSADVIKPDEILMGVFFNLSGDPTLSPVSATVAPGSTVLFGTTDPSDVVGGEWGYKNNAIPGYSSGISTSHQNGFGPHDMFPGSNLAGPPHPGGTEYGITSLGDVPTSGDPSVTGDNALIKNSVVFRLSGLPSGFNLTQINAVQFQYGTSAATPSLNAAGPIPAPATAPFLAAMVLAKRRRR